MLETFQSTPTKPPKAAQPKLAIERIYQELDELERRRKETARRIGRLQRTLAGMSDMFRYEGLETRTSSIAYTARPFHREGLTEACRRALMAAPAALSTRDVLDEVQFHYPAVSHHKNPLASVITVLNRLGQYREAVRVHDTRGLQRWIWAKTDLQPNRAENVVVE